MLGSLGGLSLPDDGIPRTNFLHVTFLWQSGLIQSCHIDVKAGKLISLFRAIYVCLVLEDADIPCPKRDVF